MYFIGALAILCLSTLATAAVLPHGKIVACPTVTSSVLDVEDNPFTYNETDWNLCTHLIVLDDEFLHKEGVSADKRNADYKKIIDLSKKYQHLQISLTVSPVETFRKYLQTNSKDYSKFFESVIEPIKVHQFNGMDMNFGHLEDSLLQINQMTSQNQKFFEMLRGIKGALQETKLYITSSFSVSLLFTSVKFNVAEHVDIFERFHIYQTAIEPETIRTFAQIRDEIKPSNVQKKIGNLLGWGIPASKLILSVMIGGPGAITELKGDILQSKDVDFLGYTWMCDVLASKETFKKSIDNDKHIASIVFENEPANEKSIFTYGTTRLAADYALFAVKSDLAGIVAVTVHNDDFRGKCKLDDEDDTWYNFNHAADNSTYPTVAKRSDNKFPFMNTINEALYKAVNVNQTVGSNPSPGSASNFERNPLYVAFILVGIVLLSVF